MGCRHRQHCPQTQHLHSSQCELQTQTTLSTDSALTFIAVWAADTGNTVHRLNTYIHRSVSCRHRQHCPQTQHLFLPKLGTVHVTACPLFMQPIMVLLDAPDSDLCLLMVHGRYWSDNTVFTINIGMVDSIHPVVCMWLWVGGQHSPCIHHGPDSLCILTWHTSVPGGCVESLLYRWCHGCCCWLLCVVQVKRFAEGFFFNELRKQETIACFDPRSALTHSACLSECLPVFFSVSLSFSLCVCLSLCVLHSLQDILLQTVLFIKLLSCLRSDIVILDKIIILLTYLLSYLSVAFMVTYSILTSYLHNIPLNKPTRHLIQ